MKTFIFIISLVAVLGCSKTESYKFEPLSGVKVNVFVGEVKVSEEENTYIQFKYEINNESQSKIRLNTENIEITVNGKKPVYVHYNNIASAPQANFIIKQGNSEHKLYLMLNGKLADGIIKQFKVIEFGLHKDIDA